MGIKNKLLPLEGNFKNKKFKNENNKKNKKKGSQIKRKLWYEKVQEREKNNKPVICKYFQSGGCQNNDCTFSHDLTPDQMKRILEPCKYYASNDCSKGPMCCFMHGNFPCQFFHDKRGSKCLRGDNCKYSHDPLTPEMDAVLQKYIRGEVMHESKKAEDTTVIRPVQSDFGAFILQPNENEEHSSYFKNILGMETNYDTIETNDQCNEIFKVLLPDSFMQSTFTSILNKVENEKVENIYESDKRKEEDWCREINIFKSSYPTFVDMDDESEGELHVNPQHISQITKVNENNTMTQAFPTFIATHEDSEEEESLHLLDVTNIDKTDVSKYRFPTVDEVDEDSEDEEINTKREDESSNLLDLTNIGEIERSKYIFPMSIDNDKDSEGHYTIECGHSVENGSEKKYESIVYTKMDDESEEGQLCISMEENITPLSIKDYKITSDITVISTISSTKMPSLTNIRHQEVTSPGDTRKRHISEDSHSNDSVQKHGRYVSPSNADSTNDTSSQTLSGSVTNNKHKSTNKPRKEKKMSQKKSSKKDKSVKHELDLFDEKNVLNYSFDDMDPLFGGLDIDIGADFEVQCRRELKSEGIETSVEPIKIRSDSSDQELASELPTKECGDIIDGDLSASDCSYRLYPLTQELHSSYHNMSIKCYNLPHKFQDPRICNHPGALKTNWNQWFS